MQNYLIVDSREAVMEKVGDAILSRATIHCDAGELLSGDTQVDPTQVTVFKSFGIFA